jgi:hypothetical protein
VLRVARALRALLKSAKSNQSLHCPDPRRGRRPRLPGRAKLGYLFFTSASI